MSDRPHVSDPRLDTERPPAAGGMAPVLDAARLAGGDAARLAGGFVPVGVNSDRLRTVPVCTAEGLPVRLVRR